MQLIESRRGYWPKRLRQTDGLLFAGYRERTMNGPYRDHDVAQGD